MTAQSHRSLSPRIVLPLIAIAVSAVIGVLASIPMKQNRVTAAPDATSLAIRDLQASRQQVTDQLKALQETVSSDRADVMRLPDEVTALSTKLESLQQSFASAHQQTSPPSAPPPAPTGQNRGAR
jgi:septal ring factor EnvC (AmiA/AmiB activator)